MTSGRIQTVQGQIEPDELRYTLPHEHLYVSFWQVDGRFDSPYMLDDDDVLAEELSVFTAQGGNGLVELTPPDIGRNPERLLGISKRTGIHVVMGCGWYRRLYYLPEDGLEHRPVQQLADELLREVVEGVGPDRIRPGVIGEIGAEKAWVAPVEERAHRAAARVQRASGLPLVTHSRLSEVALDQLTIFEDEGADLSRIAIGHCDSYPHLAYYLRLAERGVWLSFDNIGSATSVYTAPGGRHHQRLAGLIRELIDRGFEDRILLSHDICESFQLEYYGGPGFGYLRNVFIPMLTSMGIPAEVTTRITEDNPRRWLTISQ